MTEQQHNILLIIKEAAIENDWMKAFNGKSYGNRHLERVNKIANYLQQHEGGDEFITLAGAWVHDAILAYKLDDDSNEISNYTKNFLENLNIPELTKDDIEKIAESVKSHEAGKEDESEIPIEAKIIHDADVIDKSGMLGIIRHTWKMTNLICNKILETEKDLYELKKELEGREQKLFTQTGKRLVEKLNSARDKFFEDRVLAIELIKYISTEAYNSNTSDKIALSLITKYKDFPHMLLLDNQLNCGYLKD